MVVVMWSRILLACVLVTAMMPQCCSGDLLMIVEYDTNGTARPVSLNISLRTVELHVTVLGCDHGYFAEALKPTLLCTECVCTDFREGRNEAFIEETI